MIKIEGIKSKLKEIKDILFKIPSSYLDKKAVCKNYITDVEYLLNELDKRNMAIEELKEQRDKYFIGFAQDFNDRWCVSGDDFIDIDLDIKKFNLEIEDILK